MSGNQEIRSQIRTFLSQTFFVELGRLIDGDSLLGQGIMDSTGVLEVLDFLEGSLGVKASDEELLPENLDSVDALVRFVERKRNP